VKGLGDIDCLLAEGAVGDEDDFVGRNRGFQFFHFLDEVGVDLEPAGGVEEDDVGVLREGGLEALPADGGHVLRIAVHVDTEFLLFRQDLELVDGRGAIDVAGDEKGPAALFLEQLAELGRGGGSCLSRGGRPGELQRSLRGEIGGALAEELHQLVIDDLTTCWPGETDLRTAWPTQAAWTRSMNSRATRKWTSAASRAARTSLRRRPCWPPTGCRRRAGCAGRGQFLGKGFEHANPELKPLTGAK